jgi:hypothetical protein
MTAAENAAALTEFRDLLTEWERLNADRTRRRTSGAVVPSQAQLDELRTTINHRVEHVTDLVGNVVSYGSIENPWNGVNLDPFRDFFNEPRIIPDVRDLLDRAIGVYQRGGRPAPPPAPPPTTPINVDVTFVTDAALRGVLERNVRELGIAMAAEAWTSAIVLAGAIAEGALSFLLIGRRPDAEASAARIEARPPPPRIRILHKPIEAWTLWAYIEVASEMGLLSGTTNGMAHGVIREFRNMVHPQVQLRDSLIPTRIAAEGSVLYMRAVLDDVRAAI